MNADQHTILIAEDDSDIRSILQGMLSSGGFRVVEASNGRDALQLFETEHPSLVILDVGMPELGGWDVLVNIRQASEASVLMLSGRGAEADQVRSLTLGADDCLTKPFGRDQLLGRVRSLLGMLPLATSG